MCEVLLQWHDKVPPGDPLYGQNYKAGDVIALVPDGWAWSERERTNPNWRIVKLPSVTVAEATYLMTAATDPVTGALVNKRDNFVNATLIPQNVFNQIDGNQITTFGISYSALASWVAKH